MTRRLLAVLAAGALAAAPATAHAQLRTSFSLAGGLAAPVGDLADRVDAGYNLAGAVNLAAPLMPIGIRLELGYNGFNGRTSPIAYTDHRIVSGTVNATLALGLTGASPYLIGGVGAYNRRYVAAAGTSSDRTAGGFNAGGGLRFPLGTVSTFIEARYHQMLGNTIDGTNYQFIPITVGVNF
jgi:opacity protein-like surface antigen